MCSREGGSAQRRVPPCRHIVWRPGPEFWRKESLPTMKAWLLDEIGRGVDGLRVGEIPEPVPAPGEALVRVQLAGLNPADRYLSEGQYPARPTLPHILGRDGIGVIERLGPGAESSGLKVGDKV